MQLTPLLLRVCALWQEKSEASEKEVYERMTTKLVYKEYNIGRAKLSAYPRVYFDLEINGRRLPNRVIFELFIDRCPKTCENFRALCTGELGVSSRTGTKLHYKGTRFHRAFNVDDSPPEFMNESADGKRERESTRLTPFFHITSCGSHHHHPTPLSISHRHWPQL